MAQPTPAPWVPCPSGELGRLAQHLRKRRQRRGFLLATGGAAATAAGGAFAWWLGRGLFSEPSCGPLTCAEVLALAEEYRQKTLSANVRKQVDAHLDHCLCCWQVYRSKGLV